MEDAINIFCADVMMDGFFAGWSFSFPVLFHCHGNIKGELFRGVADVTNIGIKCTQVRTFYLVEADDKDEGAVLEITTVAGILLVCLRP